MVQGDPGRDGPSRRFATAKFRPTTLPATLVTRPELLGRLDEGADRRLTVVLGSAGTGKSVLLSSWAAARQPGLTSWLSCDEADADPVRFWAAFIEAPQAVAPGFGADAADLMAIDGAMSADVTASLANDAAKLPAGSVLIVDDFHTTATAIARNMTDLVERWPAKTAQLVLAGRADPPVRLHRLRLSGELTELRDRDLHLSLTESRALLANFGVQLAAADLALLQRRTEGWAAALQMAALTLSSTTDPERATRALNLGSHTLADYFISEVLEQQPPEVKQFMLDICVLDELTAAACSAVTGRQDAATLLRGLDAASLFMVALDDDRTAYRYHHLIQQVLRAELHATDHEGELALQLRAAEWLESTGDTRRATRHYLAARQPDRALGLLEDRVVSDFLRDPAVPAALDLSMLDPSLLAGSPDRLLALAADLLLWGDGVRGGRYLDLFEQGQPDLPADSRLASRFAEMQCLRYALTGQAHESLRHGLAARDIQQQSQLSDEWNVAVPTVLMRVYTWLEDYEAVEGEISAALAISSLADPLKLVLVRGAQALAWFEAGHITQAAEAAGGVDADARRLGFDQHFMAVDHLRALAGTALERRDLDAAERLTERALSISEGGRPPFEFLALLDRAQIWAARGQVHDALATIDTARRVLPGTGSVLLTRADELEALLRLSLGDLHSPAELAGRLSGLRRSLLLARISLAAGDHRAAVELLQAPAPAGMTPRLALVRQVLLAAAAFERGDPAAAGILGGVLQTARREGFLNLVVTTAPQLTSYLIEHSARVRADPFLEQLTTAALEVRAAHPDASPARGPLEPLTPAELRILNLLPTSTYVQMAAMLYVSRNTVKTHLRSIYRKLGVVSRQEAIERAVSLRLL